MGNYEELIEVITAINNPVDMRKFFNELLTPKERTDISLRWQLLKELHQGVPQRTIASNHHISLCKITRGSKILKEKKSMTKKILENINPQS